MTQGHALQILQRVWGEGRNLTADEGRALEIARPGEAPLRAACSVAGISAEEADALSRHPFNHMLVQFVVATAKRRQGEAAR